MENAEEALRYGGIGAVIAETVHLPAHGRLATPPTRSGIDRHAWSNHSAWHRQTEGTISVCQWYRSRAGVSLRCDLNRFRLQDLANTMVYRADALSRR